MRHFRDTDPLNVDNFSNKFLFLIWWSPIDDFRQNFGRQNFFSLAMATTMVAAWSAVCIQKSKLNFYIERNRLIKFDTLVVDPCSALLVSYCAYCRWMHFQISDSTSLGGLYM